MVMEESLKRRIPPFLGASLIGAYGGVSLQCALAWSATYTPKIWTEVWAIPVFIGVYGLLALPFVSLGLAIFGIPAAFLLSAQRKQLWVGLLAVVAGAVAGKIVFYAVDHLVFFGFYHLLEIKLFDMGVLYGVPTGLGFWWLHRDR